MDVPRSASCDCFQDPSTIGGREEPLSRVLVLSSRLIVGATRQGRWIPQLDSEEVDSGWLPKSSEESTPAPA